VIEDSCHEFSSALDRLIGIRDPVAEPAVERRDDEQQLAVRARQEVAGLLAESWARAGLIGDDEDPAIAGLA